MTTTRTYRDRVFACVLVAMTATVVTGIPHQYLTQDDYTRAILAQYYPAGAASKMVEITPTEPASFRSSRSDAPTVAKPVLPVGHGHTGVPDDHSQPSVSVATAVLPPVGDRARINDTSPAVTVEKLTAFYDTLKSQQEALARQQLQQQLFEQQQRRQHEFGLVQQQIQQQFYQQQQHAMMMLDQLRRNPAFAGHVAAFVDHKSASNGTAAAVVPDAAPEGTAVGAKRPHTPPATKERDQTIFNHMKVGRNDDADDGFDTKRLGSRQAAVDGYGMTGSEEGDSSDNSDDNPDDGSGTEENIH